MKNKTKRKSILRGIASYCEQFKPTEKSIKWQKQKVLLLNLIAAQSCLISKIVEADAKYGNSFNADKRGKPLRKNHQITKTSKHLLYSTRALTENYLNTVSTGLTQNPKPVRSVFEKSESVSIRKTAVKDILFFAHDGSDLQKPYARKMKGRETVRDGSASSYKKCITGSGYHIEGSIAIKNDRITPLITNLYSTKKERTYERNWNAEKRNLKTLNNHDLLRKGIHLYDRKGDDAKWMFYLHNKKIPFVIRGKEQRGLANAEDMENIKNTKTETGRKKYFSNIKKYIAEMVYEEHPDYPKYKIAYKRVIIERREYIGKSNKAVYSYFPVTMIVVKFPKGKHLKEDEKEECEERKESKIILYTSLEVNNATEAFAVFEFYKRRWPVEVYFRFIKQSFEIEKIQVLEYEKIKNMMNYVTVAANYHHERFYRFIDGTEGRRDRGEKNAARIETNSKTKRNTKKRRTLTELERDTIRIAYRNYLTFKQYKPNVSNFAAFIKEYLRPVIDFNKPYTNQGRAP